METRYRPGTGGWPNASPGLPSPGPWHESQKDLANGNPPSFIAESGRSAEFCLAHLRAKHFGRFLGQVNQPAPVETDRRPENLSHSASFAVATAPSPLREGRPPTAYQGLAEGEPIKA